MWEPKLVRLDALEFGFKQDHPNATEEEIHQYLLKSPHPKKDVEAYMVSKERKESEFYKIWLKKQGNK